VQENGTTRNPQSSMTSPVRFPGEDGGRSLAEMAQRDLDAALQLLADRAQYITGASGAAIALRRSGMSDMLCRASTGSNAPELGALLSTEFGLSGESVRTRKALRCDDAARDARVNHDVCRQLGIASVVVMPVVNDDEVLGVFELFSGKANAFGDRDLSAVQRLSEMVETAVRLAHATESLPDQLRAMQISASESASAPEVAEQVLDVELQENPALDIPKPIAPAVDIPQLGPSTEQLWHTIAASAPEAAPPSPIPPPAVPPRVVAKTPPSAESLAANQPTKKQLLWSAASAGADGSKAEVDQSHVPPVLRGLRTCEACGFPVSAGRALCVECEEKKWRGQLKRPQTK
jgi:GAF domain-containing protein